MSVTRHSHFEKQAGFTLTEMAIVIVIGALLFAMIGGAALKTMRDTKVKTTEARIKEVNDAIRLYVRTNKSLPCAANRSALRTDPKYGFALTTAECKLPATGTTSVAGVRIGMVPIRTLRLPDADSYDAWGSRFIYAVTEVLTDPTTYDLKNGAISIVDSTGTTSVIDPPGKGAYIVVSVGPDRQGGYGVDGSSTDATQFPCVQGGRLDEENCDNDATFSSTMMTSVSDITANRYDDYVSYGGLDIESSDIPDGAIVSFETGICPTGWKEFIETHGRMIIGAGHYTAGDYPPTTVISGGEPDYAIGSEGGSGTRVDTTPMPGTKGSYPNMPAYVTYINCVKDVTNTYVAPSPPAPPVAPPPPKAPPPKSPPPKKKPKSSRVVCTYYYRRGRMPDWLLRAEIEFTYAHFSASTIRGYHFWAIPLVNLMRKYAWVENIFYRPTMCRAEDIAYQMGLTDKPNYIGRALRIMVEPLCFLIGIFVPEQNWGSVHADVKNVLRPDLKGTR